jgi:hypothetical protein
MKEKIKRKIIEVRKKSSGLRKYVPNELVRGVKYAERKIFEIIKKREKIKHKSKFTNIYHFALQKTGTQWMHDIFSDPIVYKYSGMTVKKFNIPRRKSQSHPINSVKDPYPKNAIISGIGGTHKNFEKDIPKNDGKNAVLFVIRDPREMIVSWYFSTKDNHLVDPVSMMAVHRKKLRKMTKEEGIRYVIDLFEWKGKFDVIRSWLNNRKNKNVKVVKFEKLSFEPKNTFEDVFAFLDIKVPDQELDKLVYDYSFEKLTGRSRGEEDTTSHMRSGASSTWQSHLSERNLMYLRDHAADLVTGFGYD